MNFFQRLGWKLRQWMQGRYGTDALNLVLVGAGLVCSLFGRNMVLYLCSLAFLTLALLRMFSRNIPARRRKQYSFWTKTFPSRRACRTISCRRERNFPTDMPVCGPLGRRTSA